MLRVVAYLLVAASAREFYESANRHFTRKEMAEADADVNTALGLDPSFVPALTLKAKLALAANRRDVARSCLEKAAALEPRSAYVQFLLGFFYYVENDFGKAIAPLQAAHRLDPADPRAPFYLAMTHEGLGQAQDALALYEEASRLSPAQNAQRAEILVAYGRFLFNLGQYAQSADQINAALAADGSSREAHYQMAQIQFHDGRFDAAIQEGERALALPAVGVSDAQVHFLLGRAYLKLGKRELAEQHLQKFRAAPQTLQR